MATTDAQPEQAAGLGGSGRRLRVLFVIGGLAVISIVGAIFYAERRVREEAARVQEIAQSTMVDPGDVIDAAYGSDAIASKFGVAPDRISITVDSNTCITVRSEYLTSERTAAFIVDDRGALTSVGHC